MSNGNGWMPLYIGDYLGDTMELDAAQHGAYLLLLMYYWRNGPLPLDDAKLAQIARTELRVWKKTVGPVVKAFFRERDGRLHQKRADAEIAKAAEAHQRSRDTREADADRLRRWRQQRQLPERGWEELRTQIFARDGHRCQRCGATDDLHCDHILELSEGGNNDPDNLTTLCRNCHSKKTAEARSPPKRNGGETHFKGTSDSISKPTRNAGEMSLTRTSQVQPEKKEESKFINKNSFFQGTPARSERRDDALEAVLSEAGVASPSVDPERVVALVRGTKRALEMRIPYGEVRSVEAQIDALKAQPAAVGSEASMGLLWQPHEPVRTPAQQYAELTGCSLAEAEARFADIAA